ncbi:hypothetical protein MSG28_014532 [Choristoneura fumiferana]|uniref:Uncharacterized protein n=1 Tax=Choristoneura fumiferana TaxID=7141 RepID=A0ACC0JRP9_CHOFU|nr:hypothetical protein MSG28_014532 [Choristoneura fumiferana]
MAVPVPSEPECDPLDPKTYPYPLVIGIDERAAQDPCTYVPVRTTTKKPFVGPGYLPPVAARVGRSPKTLRLGDVEGARPVWHVGLYTKTTAPYKQICGGSIVRMDVVITAAHCVWNDDTLLEPAENYAVGGNKIYRPWTEPHDKRAQQSDRPIATEHNDKTAQQSDIREIIVPPRYRGGKTSFQDDIAILRLVTPFSYARGLRPVCVSFDDDFDAEQLSEGNSGTWLPCHWRRRVVVWLNHWWSRLVAATGGHNVAGPLEPTQWHTATAAFALVVAGWGYTDDIGSPTQFLLWLELPYVDIEKCIAGADDAFLKYITSDKICAGENHTDKESPVSNIERSLSRQMLCLWTEVRRKSVGAHYLSSNPDFAPASPHRIARSTHTSSVLSRVNVRRGKVTQVHEKSKSSNITQLLLTCLYVCVCALNASDAAYPSESQSENGQGAGKQERPAVKWFYVRQSGPVDYASIVDTTLSTSDHCLDHLVVCSKESLSPVGKALCKGDSGGGLVFWHSEGDLVTPYLRGVASASARADNKECNVNVVGGFTQVTAHRRFLQQHVPDIDQNCRYHYFN